MGFQPPVITRIYDKKTVQEVWEVKNLRRVRMYKRSDFHSRKEQREVFESDQAKNSRWKSNSVFRRPQLPGECWRKEANRRANLLTLSGFFGYLFFDGKESYQRRLFWYESRFGAFHDALLDAVFRRGKNRFLLYIRISIVLFSVQELGRNRFCRVC